MKRLKKCFYFHLLLLIIVVLIHCRPDGDNYTLNESFFREIEYLYNENTMCHIMMNTWKEPTAIVNLPFKMPTCLKNFQASALVPICGKPMYNKFQYCAKALFSRNRNYADIDFEAEYKKNKEILVLLDGCLTCYYWPERAANVSIKLLSPFRPTEVKTQSDAYGDFKVGAIYKIDKKGQWQIQPKLEITHQCNQFGMTQKKTVLLPALQPNLMYQMTYEKLNAEIKLMQQGLPEKTEPLVFERNRTKPLDPPKIDVDAKKP